MGIRSIIATHTIMFVAGFAAAKLYDHDELSSYRQSYEKPMTKFRRWVGNVVFAGGVVTVMMFISRITTAYDSSSTTTNDKLITDVDTTGSSSRSDAV